MPIMPIFSHKMALIMTYMPKMTLSLDKSCVSAMLVLGMGWRGHLIP